MRSYLKYVALALCVGLCANIAGAAEKGDKPGQEEKAAKKSGKDKGAKAKDKKGDKKKDDEEGDSGRMSLPIQKGHDSFGLKIPYENADGVLQMIFKVGRASRVDENHVQMADLEVETFDDEGKSEMVIDLPVSILDLNTRVLTTDSQVTIRRADFEITGSSMEFDTKTKHGRLAGNVRMLIYEQAVPEGSEAPSKEEKTQ
jgi:hypothetical protein